MSLKVITKNLVVMIINVNWASVSLHLNVFALTIQTVALLGKAESKCRHSWHKIFMAPARKVCP